MGNKIVFIKIVKTFTGTTLTAILAPLTLGVETLTGAITNTQFVDFYYQ
ncbi:hypothetical protein [Tepidibacter thalassicus]|nr:hypothetical protein [Tepidibacter thalassicus]